MTNPGTRYPLTSRQRDPNRTERAPKHVIPSALRIKGELRIDALQGALDDLVARHEALRTRVNFSDTDGRVGYQEVFPPLPVPFTVHDVPVVPGRSRDELAHELFLELHREQLDCSVTPSLLAALHRFDDQDAVLTLLTHHIYGDHWSSDLLRRELAACYNARVGGTPPALPTPVQYREYATWEEEFLRSERGKAARSFWADKLSGAEVFTVPTDRPHGSRTSSTAVKNFLIDPGESAKITASATQNRCTTWHFFLAVGALLAERIRGSSDITLLTVNNGRNVTEFHNTVGFFTTPAPMRMNLTDCETFRDVLRLARKTSMETQRNLVPFETVLELAPDLMKPLADPEAMLFVVHYVRSPSSLDDVHFAGSVEPMTLPEDVPAMFHRGVCGWNLEMLASGAFRFVVEYEPGQLDADTVDRWGSDFVNLASALADRPDENR